MAEEKYEVLEATVETLRERVAELEVEAAVVAERSGGLEPGAGETDALAHAQLVKQNERLKEALVRLRDLTADNEQESRRRIHDLEKELDLTSELQCASSSTRICLTVAASYDAMTARVEQTEALSEELRLQLDDALGAEDMLEQLTERNLTLSDKVDELTATVEDLEALKELNDELEEGHAETEKQLLEEIELKDGQLRDARRRADALEESVAEYDGTIGQFRELVVSLQRCVNATALS